MLTPTDPGCSNSNCRLVDPEAQAICSGPQRTRSRSSSPPRSGRLAGQKPVWDSRTAVAVVLAAPRVSRRPATMDEIHGLRALATEEGDDLWILHAGTRLSGDKVVTGAGGSSPSRRSAPGPPGPSARLRAAARISFAGMPAPDPTSGRRRRNWSAGGQKPGGQLIAWSCRSFSASSFATARRGGLIYLVIDFADRAHTIPDAPGDRGRRAVREQGGGGGIPARSCRADHRGGAGGHAALAARRADGPPRPRSPAAAAGRSDARSPRCSASDSSGWVSWWCGRVRARRKRSRSSASTLGDWGNYHAGSSWLRGKQGRQSTISVQSATARWEPLPCSRSRPPSGSQRRIDARRIRKPVGGGAGCDPGAPNGAAGAARRREIQYELYGGPGGPSSNAGSTCWSSRFPGKPRGAGAAQRPPAAASLAAARSRCGGGENDRPAGARVRGGARERVANPIQLIRPRWPRSD